jgi:hypothetical protein
MSLLSFGEFISGLAAVDSQTFSFVVDGSVLDSAIKRVVDATDHDSAAPIKYHLLVIKDLALHVVGFTSDVMAEVRVDSVTKITGEGYASINPAVLQGLIKQRKDLTFSVKGKNMLGFKAKKGVYSGEISMFSLDDTVLTLLNDKVASFEAKVPIKRDVFSAIRDGVKRTSLKNVYNTNQAILSYVSFSAKHNQLTVFGYDNWHLSLFKSSLTAASVTNDLDSEEDVKPAKPAKVAKGGKAVATVPPPLPSPLKSFRFSFSPSLFDTVDRFTTASSVGSYLALGLVNNSLTVISDGFRLLVPYVQSDPKEFSAPDMLLTKLGSESMVSFQFNDRLLISANNLYSLMTVKGAQYTLSYNSSAVYLSVKTSNGDARDKVPVNMLSAPALADDGTDPLYEIRFDPDVFLNLVKPLSKHDFGTLPPTLSVFGTCYRIDIPLSTDNLTSMVLIGSIYTD